MNFYEVLETDQVHVMASCPIRSLEVLIRVFGLSFMLPLFSGPHRCILIDLHVT